ncbi:sodium/hydrogen exchanger 9-like [Genypterus blacodes]|uniref:sodium/hydrogen exchanger 9-like n=1 Tax=Genypterus blacodes TaxID=154954 RepID=UPI003F758057
MSARTKPHGAALELAVSALVLLTILSVWRLKRFKYKIIHETGGAMFSGLLLGAVVKFLSDDRGEHTVSPHTETFDPEVLFNLLLPPIIFHGAYTLNQKRFIENLGSVLTFAFLGTLISCVIIGSSVYGVSRLMVLLGQAADGQFSLTDCLLFGAIVSATDPVSVLGMFSELHMDAELYTLLFGESVLNDGVAIVLTHAISTYEHMGGGHTFDPSAFFFSAGYFVGVLVASFLLGFTFTVVTALLTKFTRMWESPLLETSVFFLLSWSSFLSAEACGLSGIVSVLFCGLSQARYTVHNLSPGGKSRTEQLFEAINFLGEIFIFGYMGYVLLTFPHHVFKALFISGAFLAIFLSRVANIYPLSYLLNLGRRTKIPLSAQNFMVFAGLRGAVAFNLAARNTTTEARRAIFTTTLLLVAFTTWVLGAAADPLLRQLHMRVEADADGGPDQLPPEVTAGRPDTTPGLWHRLDYKYLKPALTHSGPPLTGSLPGWCGRLARLFSTQHASEGQEQLCVCETEAAKDTAEPEAAENQQVHVTDSEHQENLLEGDLGLGTIPALAREV